MSTYSAAILATPGLVSYWRLGESSGTVAADSKGSNTGTIAGSPTMGTTGLLTGDSNTAFTFDGVNDVIDVGNAASLQLTTLTLEAWITYSGDCIIMGKENAYGMLMQSGILVMYDWGGGAFRSSDYFAGPGVRHHMVFTIQSGVANGSQFYVDGVAPGAPVSYTILNNLSPLKLGELAGGFPNHNGVMDEVAVYNTALSAATVANHYAIGTTGIDPNASTGPPAGLMLPI